MFQNTKDELFHLTILGKDIPELLQMLRKCLPQWKQNPLHMLIWSPVMRRTVRALVEQWVKKSW